MSSPTVTRRPPGQRVSRAAWVGLGVALALVVCAVWVPAATSWQVEVSLPPIRGDWDPRFGPGTIPALLVAVAGVAFAARAADQWPWRRLLVGTYLMAVAWMTSLATVDGWAGIGAVVENKNEYLGTARNITSLSQVSTMLHEYVARIPFAHPDNWPIHIAGHPPGPLLFFVLLVALGLGGGLAAGWVVVLIAATTPVAVLVTVRRLGAESAARRAAPFLVLGPTAIWLAVSADAVFAAFAAWGLCCLAVSATARSDRGAAGWAIAAGLLLGWCVMLSYGLSLLGILALAVLAIARSWRPLAWAAGSGLAVVLTFAAAGFVWWEAYPVLRERYWDGLASDRPTSYWLWGNLAALTVSAGPLLGPAVAGALARVTDRLHLDTADRVICWLVLAAVATVGVADASGMSKAEVERIWLPFVPWLLLGCALLPVRWRRAGLVGQIVFALVLQHLVAADW